MPKIVDVESCPISIFIAGSPALAKEAAQRYCDQIGLCVTVTETEYVYTGGSEKGVVIGLINYPRFPKTEDELFDRACDLGDWMLHALDQQSYSIQTPTKTRWVSHRPEDT